MSNKPIKETSRSTQLKRKNNKGKQLTKKKQTEPVSKQKHISIQKTFFCMEQTE